MKPPIEKSTVEIHEKGLVSAFIIPQKRKRYLSFLSSPRKRKKFLSCLHHFHDFEDRCVIQLSESTNTSAGLTKELRRRGAGTECHIISVHSDLDGLKIPLDIAVKRIFSKLEGTIISCVPGKLAFYEGEAPKNRYILDLHGALAA